MEYTLFLTVACTEPFIKLKIGGEEEKCLWVSNITKSWEDAKKYCENIGSYMVTFNSKCSSRAFGEFLKLPGMPSCEFNCAKTVFTPM